MLGRISAVVDAFSLAACMEQGPTANTLAEQMEFALLECKAQLGLPGLQDFNMAVARGGSGTAVAAAARYVRCTSGVKYSERRFRS